MPRYDTREFAYSAREGSCAEDSPPPAFLAAVGALCADLSGIHAQPIWSTLSCLSSDWRPLLTGDPESALFPLPTVIPSRSALPEERRSDEASGATPEDPAPCMAFVAAVAAGRAYTVNVTAARCASLRNITILAPAARVLRKARRVSLCQ